MGGDILKGRGSCHALKKWERPLRSPLSVPPERGSQPWEPYPATFTERKPGLYLALLAGLAS